MTTYTQADHLAEREALYNQLRELSRHCRERGLSLGISDQGRITVHDMRALNGGYLVAYELSPLECFFALQERYALAENEAAETAATVPAVI